MFINVQRFIQLFLGFGMRSLDIYDCRFPECGNDADERRIEQSQTVQYNQQSGRAEGKETKNCNDQIHSTLTGFQLPRGSVAFGFQCAENVDHTAECVRSEQIQDEVQVRHIGQRHREDTEIQHNQPDIQLYFAADHVASHCEIVYQETDPHTQQRK